MSEIDPTYLAKAIRQVEVTRANEAAQAPPEPSVEWYDTYAREVSGVYASLTAADMVEQRELREKARAAYLFLNMGRCSDCDLPWPKDYVHMGCPIPHTPETL